jgi:hypothetical protein
MHLFEYVREPDLTHKVLEPIIELPPLELLVHYESDLILKLSRASD